jgi:hypothetical protein
MVVLTVSRRLGTGEALGCPCGICGGPNSTEAFFSLQDVCFSLPIIIITPYSYITRDGIIARSQAAGSKIWCRPTPQTTVGPVSSSQVYIHSSKGINSSMDSY